MPPNHVPAAAPAAALLHLPPFDRDDDEALNVIVETPKGTPNKYKLDEETGIFKISTVLPAGASFPFDFGFVPSTKGPDGDPLDVLVLMDAPAFPGCWIPSRLIGVIEARQRDKDGKSTRNDRLIAVALKSRRHAYVKDLDDLSDELVEEIEHFFISYNEVEGRKFKPLARRGPGHARKLLKQAMLDAGE